MINLQLHEAATINLKNNVVGEKPVAEKLVIYLAIFYKVQISQRNNVLLVKYMCDKFFKKARKS